MGTSDTFSLNTIYSNIQEYCESKGITEKSFRLGFPPLFYFSFLIDSVTLERSTVFYPERVNPLFRDLVKYLHDKYSFTSKLAPIVEQYDVLFNPNKKDCYRFETYYAIDDKYQLREQYTFRFFELLSGDDHMLLTEFSDSCPIMFEQQLFDYYLANFTNKNFPEELKKPLSQLSKDELALVGMITI